MGKAHVPQPWWRASVVRMEPATVRYCLLVMAAAAPKYALTPTLSRTEERAANEAGSV